MPATVIDLTTYTGKWIAQSPDGEIVAAASTYHELVTMLNDKGIDFHKVAITEVPKEDGILLL